MMKCLVGYTGFVGSNLLDSSSFDQVYNSKNIEAAYGTNPDLLVYSGVRAEKFLANKYPEEDFDIIENAIENIKKINPKAIVLISTVDVYKAVNGVNEDTVIDTEGLLPYGYNRYQLEKWVSEHFEDRLIIRLPGLYGKNIKKNFIYDLIHRIPSMLTYERIEEIGNKNKEIYNYYTDQGNGFFKCKNMVTEQKMKLRMYFIDSDYSAINFTDSRAEFQFYNLNYLWEHIEIARRNNIKLLNLATEPVTISELYSFIENKEFVNELAKVVVNYDFKTMHDDLFNGKNGYIFDKNFILQDIAKFVRSYEVL